MIKKAMIPAILLTLCQIAGAAEPEPIVTMSVDVGDVESPALLLQSLSANEAILVVRADGGSDGAVRISLQDGRVRVTVATASGPGPFPPDPDVPDPPVVPDGHLGFTRAAYDWVTDTVGLSADPDRALHAKQQAANYAAVAAGLLTVPPEFATVAAAFEALKALNREVLPAGPVRDAWAAFSGRFQDKIEPLWPFSRAEAAKILGAVGDGLEAVK